MFFCPLSSLSSCHQVHKSTSCLRNYTNWTFVVIIFFTTHMSISILIYISSFFKANSIWPMHSWNTIFLLHGHKQSKKPFSAQSTAINNLVHNKYASAAAYSETQRSTAAWIAATLILISTSLHQVAALGPGLSQAWRIVVLELYELQLNISCLKACSIVHLARWSSHKHRCHGITSMTSMCSAILIWVLIEIMEFYFCLQHV